MRFENFWETDSEGNTLPYLDGMIGRPKKEDRVRLTALRAGEVDLIDNVAYADAPSFIKDYGKTYDTWPVPQVGTAFIAFNLKNGPFSAKDNPDAHMLRMAAAHAIDHEGIHEAVFNKQGEIAKGFYSKSSPWYGKDIKSWPEFDPDKAKALRKKAKDGDAKLLIIANDSFPYMQQSGELVHAMLKDVGFNVTFEIHPDAGDPGQVQQGHLRPQFVGQQLPPRSRRLVLALDPVDGAGDQAPARLQEREGRSAHPRRRGRARQGQAPADVCRRRVADQPGPAAGLHALRVAAAGRHARS